MDLVGTSGVINSPQVLDNLISEVDKMDESFGKHIEIPLSKDLLQEIVNWFDVWFEWELRPPRGIESANIEFESLTGNELESTKAVLDKLVRASQR